MTALDYALKFAAMGWKVFPIQANSKVPIPGFKWRDQSTDDIEVIRWWAQAYPGCNWGIDCGKSGLTVIDLDKKENEDGEETWLEMQLEHGEAPETLVVGTPSGGEHHFFTGNTRNTSRKLGAGVDTRGDGGYVVAAGSSIDGRFYILEKDNSVAPLPAYLKKAIGEKTEKAENRDDKLVTEDIEHNVQAAIAYLKAARPAIEGDGGDHHTYQVACRVRDLGIAEDTALALMLAHWNERCEPPWDVDELHTKIINAYKYAQQPSGTKTAEAMFGQHTTDIEVPDTGLPSWLRRASDIVPGDIPKREWVLGYRYILDYVTVTVAPGGVGKSLLTLIEAVSIASGKELTGEPVHKKGPAIFYNGEDPLDEIERRLAAIKIYYNLTDDDLKDLYIFSGKDVKLCFASDSKEGVTINEVQVEKFCNLIKHLKAIWVGLDPLVRLHMVNENDNMAIDKVSQILSDRIAACGCAVSVVHHTRKKGKEGGNGDAETARGASSLISAARIAHTINGMTEADAKDYGLTANEAKYYIRLDGAKANLAPPQENQKWYKKVSVDLGQGDHAGVIEVQELERIETMSTEDDEYRAKAFYDILKPGILTSLNSAAKDISSRPEYSDLNDKTLISWVKNLKNRPIAVEDYLVQYVEKKVGKVRHWVVLDRELWDEKNEE